MSEDRPTAPPAKTEIPTSSTAGKKADIMREKKEMPANGKVVESEDGKKAPMEESKPIAIDSKDKDSMRIPNDEFIPERESYKIHSNRVPPRPRPEPVVKHEEIEPFTGNMKKFYFLLYKNEHKKAFQFALDWRVKEPQDALALVAIGDAAIKLGDKNTATRAYTSLIDYFPLRADIRRWAGEKLLAIKEYEEAIDTLQIALKQRPDHPSTYHLLSTAYMLNKEYKNAAIIAVKGINYNFDGRFSSVHSIMYDDLDLAYSLSLKSKEKEEDYFTKIKSQYKVKSLKTEIRFVLVWETDANDVDFHIYDSQGNHAFYSSKVLASGGELYADLTGGYGPECFRIANPQAFPYKLEAHYYSRGPMGYGMGAVQIIRFDGDNDLDIETRNFVIMNDGAFIDMGTVKQ
jgi:tetratricopeptide (TPR) repeat protein